MPSERENITHAPEVMREENDSHAASKARYATFTLFVFTVVLGIATRPYALVVGPAADDFAQFGMLKGDYPVARGVTDLFDFTDGTNSDLTTLVRSGFFPWWSHPALRLSMWRPLSSILMWFDLHAFGNHYVLYHLHSYLWWSALAVIVGSLWVRLMPLGVCAVALVLFAVDEAHGVLIAWIANRNAITSAVFGVLALFTHIAWRDRRSPRGRFVVVCSCFAVALGFGEYALTLLGYFVAYEWCARRESGRARVGALLPVVLPTVLYLALRRYLNYGPLHSGIYVDPFSEPTAFMLAAVQRIPVFFADLCVGLRADYWTFGLPWSDWLYRRGLVSAEWLSSLEPWRTAHWTIGLGAAVLYAAVAYSVLRARPRTDPLWWLTLGSTLALMPAVAPFPSSRLLVAALIGVCPLFATFVTEGVAQRRRPIRVVTSAAFGALQLLLPSWHTYAETRNLHIGASAIRREVHEMQVDNTLLPYQRMIVMNAVDAGLGFYIPLIRLEAGLAAPERCWVLSGSPTPMNVIRTGSRTFEVEYVGGQSGTGSSYEQMFRSQAEPLRVGDKFDLDGMRVEILAVRNGGFTHARFELDRVLEHPTLVFVYAGWDGLRRFSMPGLGQRSIVEGPIPAALARF